MWMHFWIWKLESVTVTSISGITSSAGAKASALSECNDNQ